MRLPLPMSLPPFPTKSTNYSEEPRVLPATGKPSEDANGDRWLTSSAGRSPRKHFPQGQPLGFPLSAGPGQFDRGYVQPRNAML